MVSATTEVRFEIERSELAVLDGYCQASGHSRVDVMRGLLREWSDQKKHESILICRTAGVNPADPEPCRETRSRFHV